jgi:hypothetical protein
MSAALARLATADPEAPPASLDAFGSVEVHGSAGMGSPRPRAETVPPTLSPARAALAQDQEQLEKLAAEVARKSKPVDRLRTQLAAATAELGAAESELAKIDAEHSAAIVEAARTDSVSNRAAQLHRRRSARSTGSAACQLHPAGPGGVFPGSNQSCSRPGRSEGAPRRAGASHLGRRTQRAPGTLGEST